MPQSPKDNVKSALNVALGGLKLAAPRAHAEFGVGDLCFCCGKDIDTMTTLSTLCITVLIGRLNG
eukprot:947161-Amphidinium_carterae.3